MSTSEEDTYSTMFASLKHPIRRRILRILSNKPESFSDLLKEFKIESSHLNYHLEGLGSLLVKTEDGRYALSSLGEAAVSTMKRVEEPPTTSTHLSYPSTRQLRLIKPLTILLICGLVTSLLFNAAFLFRNSELDKAYSRLDKTYSELNNTYNELSNAYDRLNRTYNQLNNAFEGLNQSFQELSEAYYKLNRSYFSHFPLQLQFQTFGTYGTSTTPAYYVIRDESSLVEMWSTLTFLLIRVNSSGIDPWPPPEVNFSESIVIAVFMGACPSSGYDIQVKEVWDIGQHVMVKVVKTYPAKDCGLIPESTYPCCFVKMDKTDKLIVFETIERVIDCS